MSVMELLDSLQTRAKKEEEVKQLLLATKSAADPLKKFCEVCRSLGYELYPMDVVSVGEEFYASMRRSTNGGGENSPLLDGEDDFYELFFASLME